VGFGVGLFLAHAGLGVEESIKLEVTAEGRLRLYTAGSEIGQGLASMLRIVVAEVLGVSHEQIDVVTNSTEHFDGGTGTFSARSTIFSGSATHDAAQQLLAALLRTHPTADPSDPDTWRMLGPRSIIGTHRQESPTFGFGAHAAVVRIDPDTLAVTVERLVVAYDCGRAIDRPSLTGQIAGAAVQGVGGTFLQQLPFDEQGQPQSTTFMDYLVPTVYESPDVEVVLLELAGTSSNPLGVKGGGEAGIMGAAGALANAVADALGVPDSITRLPIGPDAVLPFVDPLAGQDGVAPSSGKRDDTSTLRASAGTRPATRPLQRYAAVALVGASAAMAAARWWRRR
jgi:CO/xanthine dehydrogenase Mo-binding subunit